MLRNIYAKKEPNKFGVENRSQQKVYMKENSLCYFKA